MTCHDCNVKEGELHQMGCDMEICPKCKGQLLSCDCSNEDIVELGREPYFKIVHTCERCGKIFPDMFKVSDKEWKLICGLTYSLDCILCKECFEFIKNKREENG